MESYLIRTVEALIQQRALLRDGYRGCWRENHCYRVWLGQPDRHHAVQVQVWIAGFCCCALLDVVAQLLAWKILKLHRQLTVELRPTSAIRTQRAVGLYK